MGARWICCSLCMLRSLHQSFQINPITLPDSGVSDGSLSKGGEVGGVNCTGRDSIIFLVLDSNGGPVMSFNSPVQGG